MRLHIIQHVTYEGPGAIGEWAEERGHAAAITEQWRGWPLPRLSDFDFLVLMGGPMSANDEGQHPWLAAEKNLLREALAARKSILGVCLGAQILANVLGARVYKSPQREIGWFPVQTTPEARESLLGGLPQTMRVLHWHGETFDLPKFARRLASSEACVNQAFEFDGDALGLQFHLEVGREALGKLIENAGADLKPGPWVQSASDLLAGAEAAEELRPHLYTILDRLAARHAGNCSS